MRKITASLLIICFFATSLIFNSCKEDLCDNIICSNSGVCDLGVCTCEVGYEGTHCEVAAREKFVKGGTYSVNEEGTSSPLSQYTATIVAGDRIHEVKLKGIRDTIFGNKDVIATVSHDTIWISNQVVNGYEIEGMGLIIGKTPITGNYYYQDASIRLTYYTKRLFDNTINHFGANGSQPADWNKN